MHISRIPYYFSVKAIYQEHPREIKHEIDFRVWWFIKKHLAAGYTFWRIIRIQLRDLIQLQEDTSSSAIAETALQGD